MPHESVVLDRHHHGPTGPPDRDRRPPSPLRLLAAPVPRVVDIARFYGRRSGGIHTYLDAKARWASETGAIEHHVVVPGPRERHAGGLHELASLRTATANGCRLPLGARALHATLRALEPDVVLLHDPFWRPSGVTRVAHELGARVVAVHHGSIALDAAGLPGPDRIWHAALRRWKRRAYADADHLMSAVPCRSDCGRGATMTLRFGVHRAFAPQAGARRGDHVLYVGRLAREKGVSELLRAAARCAEPWPVRLVGSGPAEPALRRLARRLRIADRVSFEPFVSDPSRLARLYAGARVVAMPGADETFGLVGLEAAASGAAVVACCTAPSVARMAGMVHTYAPGDVDGLCAAVEAASACTPDPAAAADLAARSTWSAAFDAELADFERLHPGPAPGRPARRVPYADVPAGS